MTNMEEGGVCVCVCVLWGVRGRGRERERERENQDQSIIFRVTCDSPCPANIWKHSERTINT